MESQADEQSRTVDCEEETIKFYLQAFFKYIACCVSWKDLFHYKHFTTDHQNQFHAIRQAITPNELQKQMLHTILTMNSSSPRIFRDLVHKLHISGYTKVVSILTGKKVPTNSRNRKLIEEHGELICRHLVPVDVLPRLKAKCVISDTDYSCIRARLQQDGPWDATLQLLLLLPNKHPDWFKIFMKALHRTNHTDLANFIVNIKPQGALATIDDESEDDTVSVMSGHSRASVQTRCEFSQRYELQGTQYSPSEHQCETEFRAVMERLDLMQTDICTIKSSVTRIEQAILNNKQMSRQVNPVSPIRHPPRSNSSNHLGVDQSYQGNIHCKKVGNQDDDWRKQKGQAPRLHQSKRHTAVSVPWQNLPYTIDGEEEDSCFTTMPSSEIINIQETYEVDTFDEDYTFADMQQFTNDEKDRKWFVHEWVRQHSMEAQTTTSNSAASNNIGGFNDATSVRSSPVINNSHLKYPSTRRCDDKSKAKTMLISDIETKPDWGVMSKSPADRLTNKHICETRTDVSVADTNTSDNVLDDDLQSDSSQVINAKPDKSTSDNVMCNVDGECKTDSTILRNNKVELITTDPDSRHNTSLNTQIDRYRTKLNGHNGTALLQNTGSASDDNVTLENSVQLSNDLASNDYKNGRTADNKNSAKSIPVQSTGLTDGIIEVFKHKNSICSKMDDKSEECNALDSERTYKRSSVTDEFHQEDQYAFVELTDQEANRERCTDTENDCLAKLQDSPSDQLILVQSDGISSDDTCQTTKHVLDDASWDTDTILGCIKCSEITKLDHETKKGNSVCEGCLNTSTPSIYTERFDISLIKEHTDTSQPIIDCVGETYLGIKLEEKKMMKKKNKKRYLRRQKKKLRET